MIKSVYIKNFKAFERETIKINQHNIIIGENDAGKSTVLQALDIFFNKEKIEKNNVRDLNESVEIGIYYNNNFYKKTYLPSTFKESDQYVGDFTDLGSLKYIYIPVGVYDCKDLIVKLAAAKTQENTPEDILTQVKQIAQNSINEVIDAVDPSLIKVNNANTTIAGNQNFKYDAALKFEVTVGGIPVESRGSGYQKNLTYALLVGNNYSNVILGIDEIENSFSLNNSSQLISELQNKIGQTLFTTHSQNIAEVSNNANIIPIFTQSITTIAKLYEALGNINRRIYLLVEGKYDLPWYRKCIALLNKSSDYFVLPGGGSANAQLLKTELERAGRTCVIIEDGDTNSNNSISKECIELYTPLNKINSILGLSLTQIPQTKDDFFNATTNANRNEDSVKSILSDNADGFIDINNPLVQEVKNLLGI